jgi:hypothetical protein
MLFDNASEKSANREFGDIDLYDKTDKALGKREFRYNPE